MSNVNITQQQVADSDLRKKAKSKTVSQQPVYRAVQTLSDLLVQMRKNCPVKYRDLTDNASKECSDVLVALSLAYSEPTVRRPQLSLAIAHLNAISTAMSILRASGCVSKDDYQKCKKLVTNSLRQSQAWRASSEVGVLQCNDKKTL